MRTLASIIMATLLSPLASKAFARALPADSLQGQPDSLRTYIAVAVAANPSLQAKKQTWLASVAGACGEGQLGDPELSVGLFPKAMQHVNGKQIATFSLMQMFPWWGTLKAGRTMMEQQAEVKRQDMRQAEIDLAYDMERQWWAMLATREKIHSIDSKIKLLNDIEKVALLQYKSPSTAKAARMSDQLRLQAEEERLKEQRESLADEMRLQQRQINITMHRPEDSRLSLPDSIVMQAMPSVTMSDIEAASPQLMGLDAKDKAYMAQGEKAKGMGRPMIGIGVEYMLNGSVGNPMMPDMNGQDMWMPMLKVTLPIWRKKTTMAQRSAEIMRQATELDKQSVRDKLRGDYLSVNRKADDERRKLTLYNKEVDILDRTLQLMQAEYANGTTPLTDILQTTREQIDYALKKAEAKAAWNTAVAGMRRLTGSVLSDYGLQ